MTDKKQLMKVSGKVEKREVGEIMVILKKHCLLLKIYRQISDAPPKAARCYIARALTKSLRFKPPAIIREKKSGCG